MLPLKKGNLLWIYITKIEICGNHMISCVSRTDCFNSFDICRVLMVYPQSEASLHSCPKE